LTFYSAEEVNIALNEGRLELNARVRIRAKILNWRVSFKIIQTTAGRVIFNEVVPEAAGYINDVTKKTLEILWSRIQLVYLKRLPSWIT
jgi:DNA-directed RNA polymerase subunit beta'